ncbi:MAG TPA: alkaline phosphatase family protein, partial [Acidimicrobiales bacterium]|nr:alkaline phosphatase family protein [Acidimicrobiales bacterium]
PSTPSLTAGEYVTASQSTPVNGAPPADTSYAAGQPIGLGVRVPMLVVSPFSQGGYVCSDVFDHTSQLQFLGAIFGVDGTVGGNVSAWRQSAVGDLTSTLTNFPLPTSKHGTVYPKAPKLPKTNDKDTVAPVSSPLQCAGSDLDELGGSYDSQNQLVIYDLAFRDCTTTEGSNVVSAPLGSSFLEIEGFPTGMIPGLTAYGPGIPDGTKVTKVTKGSAKKPSTATLSNPATASADGSATLTFILPVAVYPIPSDQPLPTEVNSTLKNG